MISEKKFTLKNARPDGEEVKVAGTGLFIASRAPIEASVAFDGPNNAQVPITEGDFLEVPFSSFWLFHPFKDAGTLRAQIMTQGEKVHRSRPATEKRVSNNSIRAVSGAGKYMLIQFVNASLDDATGRLVRVTGLDLDLIAAPAAGMVEVRIGNPSTARVAADGAHVLVSGPTTAAYKDGRLLAADGATLLPGPVTVEQFDRSAAPGTGSVRVSLDPAVAPRQTVALDYILRPQESMNFVLGTAGIYTLSATFTYSDEG